MKRLTLRELRKRIDRQISEFGNMPVYVSDNCIKVNVEDRQSVLLAEMGEVLEYDSENYEKLVSHLNDKGEKYIEHPIYDDLIFKTLHYGKDSVKELINGNFYNEVWKRICP